jgi:hydrogenase-4 component B
VTLLVIALGVVAAGGLGSLAAARWPRAATAFGAGGALVGSALGLAQALSVLVQGAEPAPVDLPWSVPMGRLALGIDALSAFFLVPLFVVSALAAVYAIAYLRHEGSIRSPAAFWLWYDALVASIALVLTARSAVLFLVAWELMALASYLLVVFHHERGEVRKAGWTYLAATHLGTAFLLVFFLELGRASGSLDFASFVPPRRGASVLFGLALVGFGSKAGLFPMHVWLPEAHPAAPSPVSALLSGVMLKTGLYGIVRALGWLGPPRSGFGVALLVLGLASGLGGALLAVAQRDLKRLLAYSSVENVGVIALGLGIGTLGAAAGAPAVAAGGYAGALLHVWGHAAMKSLLFLGAGSVREATGTLDLERLGGLLRRMPRTGTAFVVGAAALCGLPPFVGFSAELALLLAAIHGVVEQVALAPLLAALAGLALVSGLAIVGFAKAVGIALLGEPRSGAAEGAHEVARSMTGVCGTLAAVCAALGLASPLVIEASRRIVLALQPAAGPALDDLCGVLWRTAAVGACLGALVGAIGLARGRLLRNRLTSAGPTWDCGYGAPSPRMQYTGSSFVEPLTRLLDAALGPTRSGTLPSTLFPLPSRLESRAPDPAREWGFAPLFGAVDSLARRLRWLQGGSAHLYVLYVVLATLALFLWKLG